MTNKQTIDGVNAEQLKKDDRLFHVCDTRNCNAGWVNFIKLEGPGEARVRTDNGAVPIVLIENLSKSEPMEKQTIDGVSRETIQRIADHCKFWIDHPYLEAIADVEVELRALLDSPPRCPGCGYTEQDCREQMDHYLCGMPEPEPANKPDAQPQGEVERLRAELAERDALLRQAEFYITRNAKLRNAIDAALSTSAEINPRGEAVAWRYHDEVGISSWFDGSPSQINLDFVGGRGGRIELAFSKACENKSPSHSGDANEMVAKVVLPTLKVEPSEDDDGSDIFDLDWVHDRAMAFGYNEAINDVAKLNGIKP